MDDHDRYMAYRHTMRRMILDAYAEGRADRARMLFAELNSAIREYNAYGWAWA